MITEKLIFKVPYEIPPPSSFHPSDLTGGQLYLRKDQATASSWVSDIGTARDFVQATSTQQPTITTNSVDFDGVNDSLKVTESDAFFSDNIGIMFFSFYHTIGASEYLLCSADEASNSHTFRLSSSGGTDIIFFQVINLGTNNIITFDTTTLVSGYNYGYIATDGSTYTGSLNGVSQTIGGVNNGLWFNDIANRDNLTLGSWFRSSTAGRYTPTMLNKLYYNNTALTSGEIADMNTFMSDPTNY